MKLKFSLLVVGTLLSALAPSARGQEPCETRYHAFVSRLGGSICASCGPLVAPSGVATLARALEVPQACIELIDVHSAEGRSRLRDLGNVARGLEALPRVVAVGRDGRVSGSLEGFTVSALRGWGRELASRDAAISAVRGIEAAALAEAAGCEAPEARDAASPAPLALRLPSATPLAIAPVCDPAPATTAASCASGADELAERARAAASGESTRSIACREVDALMESMERGAVPLSARARERMRALGGRERQSLASGHGLRIGGLVERLADPRRASAIHSQLEAMRELSAADGGAFDPALALAVAYRESGNRIFGSGEPVSVYMRSGMESLGNLYERHREAGTLSSRLPERFTRRWVSRATMSPARLQRELERRYPGALPCSVWDVSGAAQFIMRQGYHCNEGQTSYFPDLSIPPEHLVAAAAALVRQSRERFEERARELGFGDGLASLSPRARRFWTQLFFAKPGRARWGSAARYIGGHAFLERLAQLRREGRIPSGTDPLEFAVTWPEFHEFATGRRAWASATEAGLIEETLLGSCGSL